VTACRTARASIMRSRQAVLTDSDRPADRALLRLLTTRPANTMVRRASVESPAVADGPGLQVRLGRAEALPDVPQIVVADGGAAVRA
jgi:hypothetical protein